MVKCNKCISNLTSNYCSECGRAAVPPKIDSVFIAEELRSIFNFERGIFYSIGVLSVAPGKHIREFIEKDRSRLVKPLIFLIICSLTYTFLFQFVAPTDIFEQVKEGDASVTVAMFEWIVKNSGYANILMSVFIAGWLLIFFRKQSVNFFEVVILLCYAMGVGMLIFSIFLLASYFVGNSLDIVSSVISFAYCSWAIASFYQGHRLLNFVKAFFAYLLGAISFYLFVFAVGKVITLLLGQLN